MLAIRRDFPRAVRLLNGADYQRVFKQARKASDQHFTVLARANPGAGARLGLAVAKKQARRAVDRNRLKRLIRESFRHHQDLLAGLDLVVMIRPACLRSDNASLRLSLEKLWQKQANWRDAPRQSE